MIADFSVWQDSVIAFICVFMAFICVFIASVEQLAGKDFSNATRLFIELFAILSLADLLEQAFNKSVKDNKIAKCFMIVPFKKAYKMSMMRN